ncbi:tetratricopeptide repeat protein [Lysobacter sp. 1R34A]|uniref:YfaP family protein n=1 Tax=Lysobacter sp. 1R34A TaxID=3445786 RepID=UPI003EF05BED
MLRRVAALALVFSCVTLCGGTARAFSPNTDTGAASLDGLRIVLSWNAADADLDSHLSYPDRHVYFERKTGDDARLDLDGSGRDAGAGRSPETLTLLRKQAGYGYTYAVHDFGNRNHPAASALSRSGAQVSLYLGGQLLRSYAVPRDRPGNLWRVFRIDGEGRFEDIDRIDASTAPAERVDAELDRLARLDGAADGAGGDEIDAGRPGPAAAANQRGEAAYRAGHLEGAVAAYQQSIELDPGYALAYSNLGLAYLKLGRSAEAIWASRQAIALARGAGAGAIRAGAYYNIGRLLEDDGRYDEAMSNYLSAKREQADPTYDRAIERVRGL